MNDNIEIDDLIGQNIQGYQIVQRIGTSTVFLAYQDTPDKQFALKIFYPDPYACNRTEILERIQSIIPLRHKNIVTVYQAGETEKFIYAVMEYIPGENLYDLMQRNPRLHWGAAAELALEITHGLVYAQDHSITHRTLHPDRVLLGTQGQIKINFCNEGEITPTPEVANYVAPEFFLGETLTSSADIYSLGAIIYHIVTGNAPLSGDTPKDIIRKHREADPVLPNYGVADIPHSLSLTLSRALTADLKLRYQNAYELQAALHNFLLNDIKNYKLGSYKSLLPIVVEVSQSGRAFSQALDLEKVRKSTTQRIENPQVESHNAENNGLENSNKATEQQKVDNNEAIVQSKVDNNEAIVQQKVDNNNKIEEMEHNNNIDSKNENALIDTSNQNNQCCIKNLQSLKKQVYFRYFLSLFLHIIACIVIFLILC